MNKSTISTLTALLLMVFQAAVLGAYNGAHQNPDGTWVCGGAYSGAHQNPDSTWVVGGAHNGAHQNPDGTWVVGWKSQQGRTKSSNRSSNADD